MKIFFASHFQPLPSDMMEDAMEPKRRGTISRERFTTSVVYDDDGDVAVCLLSVWL
jgi:hypothetical protein